MRMYDIILKKRNGMELNREEINFFVRGYAAGDIPDYQAAALVMAVFFRGLTAAETAELTLAMVNSGEQVDLTAIPGIKVDKHSTGGVGDKTTLILAPLVAAAGVPVAKMSGRGLGHTGGTIDKLESIPGFKVDLSPADFIKQVTGVKAAVVAQTGNLVPADKKLYALRDVTATVDSIPLIASSVMSKKLASGADAILLDVKTGSGAFMRRVEDAFELARTMVSIGTRVGRSTVALVTDMDQPLGRAVGNAIEVKEAIETLQGKGPADLTELCLTLGGHMLALAGTTASPSEGKDLLAQLLNNGQALEKFKAMVKAQGGNPDAADNPSILPQSQHEGAVPALASGVVQAINAESIGRAAMLVGAGREKKDSAIDLSVGIVIHKKIGDKVSAGESLATIFYNDPERFEKARDVVQRAYSIANNLVLPKQLLHGIVTKEDLFGLAGGI